MYSLNAIKTWQQRGEAAFNADIVKQLLGEIQRLNDTMLKVIESDCICDDCSHQLKKQLTDWEAADA